MPWVWLNPFDILAATPIMFPPSRVSDALPSSGIVNSQRRHSGAASVLAGDDHSVPGGACDPDSAGARGQMVLHRS
jgi:hypothetical protein